MAQKITPALWFDGNAEEAMDFYCSIFEDARRGEELRSVEGMPFPPGSLISGTFYLFGQEFLVINGGPDFKFTPAVSFMVNCESQAEVDELWDRLTAGGAEQPCGWLVDKFGLSWQITPRILLELVNHPDPVKAQKTMDAMLKMRKIEIRELEAAVA